MRQIYFIRAGKAIKIGVAVDVGSRAKDLQGSSALPLKILGTCQEDESVNETVLHRQFRSHLIRGEWFKASPELLAYVRESSIPWTARHPCEQGRYRRRTRQRKIFKGLPGRPNLNRQRINITMPPEVLARVDRWAASEGKTRSDVIELACRKLLGIKSERKRGK